MKVTEYILHANIGRKTKFALIADLHGRDAGEALRALEKQKPDVIAMTGDIFDGRIDSRRETLSFFRECAAISPSFFSLGNHETELIDSLREDIIRTGVVLLDDSFTCTCGLTLGGLTSGYFHSRRVGSRIFSTPAPDTDFLDRFERADGYKILLCHHPEYYPKYLQKREVDLVLSGHAHGGQIRLFGRGLFAPGQGILPKYTKGIYDSRLVVSTGLSNTAGRLPRLFNETEAVFVTVLPVSGGDRRDK